VYTPPRSTPSPPSYAPEPFPDVAPTPPPSAKAERTAAIQDFFNRDNERKATVAEYKEEQIADSQYSDKQRQVAEDVIMNGIVFVLTAGIGPELLLAKIPKPMIMAQALGKAEQVLQSSNIHKYLVRKIGARMVENGELESLASKSINMSSDATKVVKQFIDDLAYDIQKSIKPTSLIDEMADGTGVIKKTNVMKYLDEAVDAAKPAKPQSPDLSKLARDIIKGKQKAKSAVKKIVGEKPGKAKTSSKAIQVKEKTPSPTKLLTRSNKLQTAALGGTSAAVVGGTVYGIGKELVDKAKPYRPSPETIVDAGEQVLKHISLTGIHGPRVKDPVETGKRLAVIGGLDMPAMNTDWTAIDDLAPVAFDDPDNVKPVPEVSADLPTIVFPGGGGGGGSSRPGVAPATMAHCPLLYERRLNGEDVEIPPECEEYFNWADLHYNKKERAFDNDRSATKGRPHSVRRPGARAGYPTSGDASP
jgi:hypothetical protein